MNILVVSTKLPVVITGIPAAIAALMGATMAVRLVGFITMALGCFWTTASSTVVCWVGLKSAGPWTMVDIPTCLAAARKPAVSVAKYGSHVQPGM